MNPSLPSQAQGRLVDLAIIGGGINGAGLAAQAARAGLSVVLFEKGDFASGTSSKSTKLIHGGIRYLEQANFSLVFEALHERHRLLQEAPHLVQPIPFLLPSYQGDRRPPWMLKLGLWLYDLLAGAKNIAPHRWLSSQEALQAAPGLNPQGLRGCGLYYDAQVNDARLVLVNILAAEEAGALCLNYCPVTQVHRGKTHFQVLFHDPANGQEKELYAHCLVNASGPWANQTTKLISGEAPKMVRPTRGSHIVLPQALSQYAVLVTTQKDNRIVFVIPWRGYSLVGTTDLDDPENPDKVKPTEEEIQYLLSEACRVFPQAGWSREKVLAAFSGLRPLAWSEGGHASSVSREDRIIKDGNLLSIVGGKLTTYRSMAEKALRKVCRVLEKPMPSTVSVPLPGAPQVFWKNFLSKQVPEWINYYGLKESQILHLAQLYGQKAEVVLNLSKSKPGWMETLHPERPEILAQVAYAVQKEKALHLEDVLLRRLEIGYSPYRWGEAAEKSSRLMAQLLGWSEEQRRAELEQYRQNLYPQPSA